MLQLFAFPLLLLALTPQVSLQDAAAIYGADTRVDVEALSPLALQKLAHRSTAAQIPHAMISEDISSGALRLGDRRLGDAWNLCADEAFVEQFAIATCSGTLIAPQLLLTAGHCMQDAARCETSAWVFGFNAEVHNDSAPLDRNARYSCRAVHALRAEWEYGLQWDYAVVELDRPVTAPYAPATVASGIPDLPWRTPLYVFSHPSGLPLKADLDAWALHENPDNGDSFSLIADTFRGSSGGGVFLADTLELVGILARTAGDYVFDSAANCYRPLRFEEPDRLTGNYESASYAWPAIQDVCDLQLPAAAELCDGLIVDEPEPIPPDVETPLKSQPAQDGCHSLGSTDTDAGILMGLWGWLATLALIRTRSRQGRRWT